MNKIELTKSRKIALIVAGALLVPLAIWYVFRPAPINVETGPARFGSMLVTIDAEGKTRFRDKVTVTAPVSGKMSRIRLREGDLIPKEYVLAMIDPNPPTPRVPSEIDNFPNVYAAKVYAPITGRLLRIMEKDERIIPAGTPILEMGNPEAVEIIADVLSTDASQIRPGATVLIGNESIGEPLKARVRTVEPQAITKVSALGVEEQRVNIIADFLTKNSSFGDNFRIDLRFVVWHGENILKIPASALFREGADWAVFTIEYGTAYKRKVTVGHRSSAEAEILEGLNEDETVILHPPSQLIDGSSVHSR